MKYEIVLRPLTEEDGGGWAAYVPDLPGCMGDGETPDEALRDVDGAIQSWIETAKELGEEIPKPSTKNKYSGKFTLRVPKSLHEALDKRARDDGVSLNQTCIHLLSLGLGTERRREVKPNPNYTFSSSAGSLFQWVPSMPQKQWGINKIPGVPGLLMVSPKGVEELKAQIKDTDTLLLSYAITEDGHKIPIDPVTGKPYPVRRAQYKRETDHSTL